jgi:hypothetical protein
MPTAPLPLKDIHTPPIIGWWPPALGWWLAAIALLLTLFFLIWLYKKLRRKTALKTAKTILNQLKHDSSADQQKKLRQLSSLLRRVAISKEPRAASASLTGEAWLRFLDSSLQGSPFSLGIGRYLIAAPYQKSLSDEFDIEPLIALCETWLKAQSKRK